MVTYLSVRLLSFSSPSLRDIILTDYRKMYWRQLLLSLVALLVVSQCSEIAFFVDPENGDDGNDGLSQPTSFQTIPRAQIAVQDSLLLYSNITVFLGGGVYDQSNKPIRFTAQDSGTSATNPIRYTALDETDPPVVSAGVFLDIDRFEVVEVFGRKMLMYDLNAHFTSEELGELQTGKLPRNKMPSLSFKFLSLMTVRSNRGSW